MSRQSGSPAARAGLLQAPPDGVGVQAEYRRGGVNYRILGADGQQSLNGSRSQVEDTPSPSWSVFDSGIRMRPLPSPTSSTSPSAARRPRRPAAARRA